MANNVMDELLYFAVGVGLAKVVKIAAKKYADPKASMNIAMLKQAGKPSVYIPGGLGVAATGYAVYQGDKYGRLKDEELVAAGFGITSLIDTVGDLLAPTTATSTAVRYAPGGAVRVGPGAGMVPTQGLRGVA